VEGLGATNNVVERVLCGLVVQRRIMGILRNEKGTIIYEMMMTLITAWNKQGLDTFEQMKTISSTIGQRAEYIQSVKTCFFCYGFSF
jgi:hypothetical protein